jgi:hypothetical protein
MEVDVYTAVINNHVRPIIESLWVTFKIQKMDTPFLLKVHMHTRREREKLDIILRSTSRT